MVAAQLRPQVVRFVAEPGAQPVCQRRPVVAGGTGARWPIEDDRPLCSPVTTSPTEPPAPENEVVRTTGEVVAGVEPGCLLLDNGETRYLLLGSKDNQLTPGRRVTVAGVADPGTPTTCMEGIPLRVTEVTPAR